MFTPSWCSKRYLHYCRCSSTEKQMFKEREQNVRVWKIMPVKRVSDWSALKKMGKQCSSKLCQNSHHSKGAKDLRSSGQHSRTKGVGPTAVSEHNEPLLNIHWATAKYPLPCPGQSLHFPLWKQWWGFKLTGTFGCPGDAQAGQGADPNGGCKGRFRSSSTTGAQLLSNPVTQQLGKRTPCVGRWGAN